MKKKWTVMVMPQSQGNSRTFHLHSGQVSFFVGAVLASAFAVSFLYGRYQSAAAEALEFRRINLQLQQTVSRPAPVTGMSETERTQLEERLRAEFGVKDEKIKAELNELYDLETQVRAIHGLPPKTVEADNVSMPDAAIGGKGGGLGEPLLEFARAGENTPPRPPSVIYGLADPPADLIVQEIHIRTASLAQLLNALDMRRDEVERMPSVWPTRHPRAYISSRYGHRIDPFSRDLRRHDGVDFPAPHGSDVIATAKGVVKEAHYDQWLGNMVIIDHGAGIETLYGHMSAVSVAAGNSISRGDVVGKVGSTGRSTGAHIHYEVRVNGKLTDPAHYLNKH